MRTRFSIAAISLLVAACTDAGAPPAAPRAEGRRAGDDGTGGVYTLTNGAAGNAVIAFRRAADGSLTPAGTHPTGGLGTGGTIDPLVSQYALILSDDNRLLFAVNAGSDQVSAFRVGRDARLELASVAASGGDLPVSLAVHGNLLYVLNAGDNTLSALRAVPSGELVQIPNSTRPLAAGAAGAAAVRFTPDGRYLVVAERVSARLEVFPVLPNGRLGDPVVTPSNGPAPFGFDVTPRNQPIVSEAANSAVSSYDLLSTGALAVATGSLGTQGRAACWLILTEDGGTGYVINAGTGTVTGVSVSASGALALLDANGITGETGTGSTPLDPDFSEGDEYLYVLEAGTGTIGAFAVSADGSLAPRPDTPAGAPASGLQGMAAF